MKTFKITFKNKTGNTDFFTLDCVDENEVKSTCEKESIHIEKIQNVTGCFVDSNGKVSPIIGNNYLASELSAPNKLVSEDSEFWIFEDKTRHPKDYNFTWDFTIPVELECSEVDNTFSYEMYSEWSKNLAKSYPVSELEKEVSKCENLTGKYALSHLNAIKRTTSMQSNSQARAHAGNNVTSNYQRKIAYKNAIEIHKNFPELSFKS
jgi:hypothetical protein